MAKGVATSDFLGRLADLKALQKLRGGRFIDASDVNVVVKSL